MKKRAILSTDIGTVGYLDGKVVAIMGHVKNEKGVENIRYEGDGVEGVCMKSYWRKYAREEKKEEADTSQSVSRLY
jgi:predicted fused transcriptional regulator/phosphomethylpyrimidine kinase